MAAPIRIEWWNRPGWGEFLALRGGKPTHGGFDSYTEPKATIYGTADNGRVVAKGFVGGMQWGYYIDVFYPKAGSRPAYLQRDCHLHEMAGIAVDAPVTTKTALGRVGRSGNAAGIFWPASQSPNGRELWHVHSEVYLSSVVDFGKRTNPHSVWGSSLAGGGITILTEPEQEHTVRIIQDEKTFKYYRLGEFSALELDPKVAAQEVAAWHPDGKGVALPHATVLQLVADANAAGKALTAKLTAPTAPTAGASKADVVAAADRVIQAMPTKITGALSK